MSDLVPHLTSQEIQARLKQLMGVERQHFLFALHGSALEHSVKVEGAPVEQVPVIPVRSELDLRRKLLKFDGTCAAFLVPWEGSLPMDLSGRFASRGAIQRIGSKTRVLAMFGALESPPEVHQSVLAHYLLEHEPNQRFAGGGVLTLDRLWLAWLDRAWGVFSEGELALDSLLSWAAADGRGPDFIRTIEQRNAAKVRTALHEHIRGKLGEPGVMAWHAWERGQGAAGLELAILAAAVVKVGPIGTDPGVDMWWQLTMEQCLGKGESSDTAVRLAAASEPALRGYKARTSEQHARKLVEAADKRTQVGGLAGKLAGSTRLPSAWRARLDALGVALKVAAKDPCAQTLADAARCRQALSGHEFFKDDECKTLLERAEMALRLVGWLAARSDRTMQRSLTPYAEVESLATWYAQEGGYVDWARRWARGGGTGELFTGIADVLEAADVAREELDRNFARALPSYMQARRPATQCVPIDQALERIAGPFLKENADRQLLVLLMDGMAWAQALEILSALGEETVPWGPLAWHAYRENRIGEGLYPAVLANFPTVTDVSRGALFAGKPMIPGKVHKTEDDPERWQKNKLALAYCDPTAEPLLLLRGEGQTRDGSASSEALSLIEDKRRRVVAVVINAIDSSLKADSAQRIKWTANTIKSLRDLLDKSRQVGRNVLFCADHGHVPADRLKASGMAKKDGARWRTWENAEDPVAEFEVGLAANNDGVWAPRGAHGVVVLADDGRKYGGGASAGEHGGASLAEAITPCVLIGCDDHPRSGEDLALRVRPVAAPGWWHFDASERATPSALEGKSRRKRRTSAEQTVLPMMSPSPRVSGFSSSALFVDRVPQDKQARVSQAVEFLLAKNGIADAAAFASAMNSFTSRISGLVATLQESLNIDGYQVLSYDRAEKQVRLDRGKLAELFEVKL